MDSQNIDFTSEFDNATSLQEVAQQLESYASELRSKQEQGWKLDSINRGKAMITKEEGQSVGSSS